MTEITVKGKTVDQAIEKALYELGTTRDEVEVKILSVGGEGILGLLGLHRAKVRVALRQNVKVQAARFLEGLLEKMGMDAQVSPRETKDTVWIEIELDGDGGLLIGHRGQTLQALQLLTERALSEEESDRRRIVVDVNRYLRDREERLVERAQALANKAASEGRSMRTEPLPDLERRIVHHALRSDGRVETRSVGGGQLRPVVIAPKGSLTPAGDRKSGRSGSGHPRGRPHGQPKGGPRRRSKRGRGGSRKG